MATNQFQGSQLSCSFCGKSQREVKKLIAGPTVYICDECIRLCTDIIDEEKEVPAKAKEAKVGKFRATPREIVAFLDQYVIGQTYAKKILSVAVYNHYKRIREQENLVKVKTESGDEKPTANENRVEIAKSNVLLVGPTGTGKTLLAKSLARFLDVPFTVADATTLTEAGYVGEDVENIIANLLSAAEINIERAQRGIVYIDEIDKIAKKVEAPSMARDVSGEGVQQALLKLIEGSKITVPMKGGKKYGQSESLQVDTTNILVICAGSFTGLDAVIRRRVGQKGLGFGAKVKGESKQALGELLRQVRGEDLNAYGLIPEFVGRLPIFATMDELSSEDLRRILLEPKNSLIRQYQKLFGLEKVELSFDSDAIDEVVRKAEINKSGARGLRSILEAAMLDIMYEVPFLEGIEKCNITRQVIQKSGKPVLTFSSRKSA